MFTRPLRFLINVAKILIGARGGWDNGRRMSVNESMFHTHSRALLSVMNYRPSLLYVPSYVT